jgi:hypothetical protein
MEKNVDIVVLISRKMDFKSKRVNSARGNIYAPNIRAPKYIKQILIDLKTEAEPMQ